MDVTLYDQKTHITLLDIFNNLNMFDVINSYQQFKDNLNFVTHGFSNISQNYLIYGSDLTKIIETEYPTEKLVVYIIVTDPNDINLVNLRKNANEYINTNKFYVFTFHNCVIKIHKIKYISIQQIIHTEKLLGNDLIFFDKTNIWICNNHTWPKYINNESIQLDPYIKVNNDKDNFLKALLENKMSINLKNFKTIKLNKYHCWMLCKQNNLNMLKKCKRLIHKEWLTDLLKCSILSNSQFALIQYIIEQFNDSVECTNKLSDIINLCIRRCRYDVIEYMLFKNIVIPIQCIFDAIASDNKDFIKILINKNVNLNVVNTDGYNPIEYAMNMYINNNNFYDLIQELNKFLYVRNPKIWAFVNNLNLYTPNFIPGYEKHLFQSLHKIQKTCDGKKIVITQINDVIIRKLIKYNRQSEILEFLKYATSMYDMDILCYVLIKYKSTDIVKILIPILGYDNAFAYVMLKLRMFDEFENVKKDIDIISFIKKIIIDGDYKSLIYLCQYVDSNIINYKDENDNNILHMLCKNANSNNILNYITCFDYIVSHNDKHINEKNKYGNTPIFMFPIHGEMISACVESKCDINCVNYNGDNIIHHIVRYSTGVNVIINIISKVFHLINQQNNDKETPLMLAIKQKKINMCNILLSNGCDYTLVDKHGNSVFHYIKKYNLNIDELQKNSQNIINIYGNSVDDYGNLEYI